MESKGSAHPKWVGRDLDFGGEGEEEIRPERTGARATGVKRK
jgi:hypothetical protein